MGRVTSSSIRSASRIGYTTAAVGDTTSSWVNLRQRNVHAIVAEVVAQLGHLDRLDHLAGLDEQRPHVTGGQRRPPAAARRGGLTSAACRRSRSTNSKYSGPIDSRKEPGETS